MNTFLINTLSIVVLVLVVSCSNHNQDHDHDQHVHSAACNHNDGSNDNSGLNALTAPEAFENIHVEKLYSDSLATAFVIWAKQYVKAHKHLFHTESIYVLDGEAVMVNGMDTLNIRKGDFIFIPMNTVHSVLEVKSDQALKVISIQSPEFKGEDRVFVD